MSADVLSITVSYAGAQKVVSLAVKPSLELSDTQVDYAESELQKEILRAFRVVGEAGFYLHEAESGRIMSKESFREPAYCEHFPRYWYLEVAEQPGAKNKLGHEDKEGVNLKAQFSMDGVGFFPGGEEDEDELSLEQMIRSSEHSDTKYRTFTLTCNSRGQFGFTLRHFSIQPNNIPGSDTPVSQRTHSRSDSFASADSSLETLKLATTFVSHVAPGGVAEGAGLEKGLVVHMINEENIIRSTSEEITELLGQCGEEISLLSLSKEHDDLQFLYPQYTYGSTGDYSTEEGNVSACDIPVVMGTGARPANKHKGQKVTPLTNGDVSPTSSEKRTSNSAYFSPLTGLKPFVDDGSQDNSQSCDQPVRQPSDDVLITGSLHEIENHEWSLSHDSKGRTELSPGLYANGDLAGFTPRELDLISEDKPEGKWYEEDYSYDSIEKTRDISACHSQPLESLGRVRSNSIKRRHSARHKDREIKRGVSSMTGSMTALDNISADSKNISRSVDLGRYKIKKGGDKSLAFLTRIEDKAAAHSITRHRSDEHTHRVNLPNRTDRLSDDNSWMHQSLDSTTSPPQGSDSSGLSTSGQAGETGLSGQSYDDQRTMSGESLGHAPNTPSHTPSHAPRSGRKPARGYQMQRARLHNSRSKISDSDLSLSGGGERMRRRRGSETSDTTLEHTPERRRGRGRRGQVPSSSSPQPVEEEERKDVGVTKLEESHDVPVIVSTPTPPTPVSKIPVRQHSLKQDSPPKIRRPRPASAVEPQAIHRQAGNSTNGMLAVSSSPRQHPFTRSVEVPTKRIPLHHTKSANIPQRESYREVNIEEAIARSQMSQSLNTTETETGRIKASREVFKREKYKSADSERGLGMVSSLLRLSTELLTGVGLPQESQQKKPEILMHGVLGKKQDLTDSGKRSQDRSWKHYYAVLSGSRIVFYKDKRDSFFGKPCDEPPIEVVPSTAFVDSNYAAKKKMKFVFRVATNQGSEFLLQASDAPSLQRWVDIIQQLNGGVQPSNEAAMLKVESTNKLTPGSPIMQRRVSSPQPQGGKAGKKKDEGGKGLMAKFRRAINRDKDEPDFSSFVTFGQPLEACPVSPDNKRVPLVVECCVEELERLGLEVEGIYRKVGTIAKINSLSAEMDKGNYSLSDSHGGDVHILCSLLKKFFKELPDSLIPMAMYDEFVACGREQDEETRLTTLKDLVFRLPTAHYHTLRYLMKHLTRVAQLSDLNKMTHRNVALVFGPTLMPNPTSDTLQLDPNMNASYVVIELLCKKVEVIFDAELCEEEQRLQEELTEAMQRREAESSPSRQMRDIDKETALLKASPLSVRRIKNNLTPSSDGVSSKKRNSLIESSTFALPPKQLNVHHTPSPQLTSSSEQQRFNQSFDSSISPESSLSRDPRGRRLPKQHVYEDVERVNRGRVIRHSYEDVEASEYPTDSISRTKHWVKQHNELGWANDSSHNSDEPAGSMWAARGQRDRKEKAKKSTRSRSPLIPPTSSVDRDLLYRSSSTSHQSASHQSLPNTLYGNRRSMTGVSTNRRISYNHAVGDPTLLGDLPVKESRRERDRAERFSSSEHYTSRPLFNDDGWKAETRYQPRQYGSLHRTTPPSHVPLGRRRSSDPPGEHLEPRHTSFSISGHRSSGSSLHRTYSSDSPPERGEGPAYRGDTPSIREEGLRRGSPTTTGMNSRKFESYL